MFDFDAGKLIIVGIVAIVCIPSKDLPRVLRQAGQFVGKMRRMASEFQGQFMDAMREADMADLRKEAQKLADSAKVDLKADMGFGAIDEHNRSIMQALDRRPGEPTPPALEPPAHDRNAHDLRPHDLDTHDPHVAEPARESDRPAAVPHSA